MSLIEVPRPFSWAEELNAIAPTPPIIGEAHDCKFKIIINKRNRTKFTRGRAVKVKGYKKAIITLKKGQSIDLTTGI